MGTRSKHRTKFNHLKHLPAKTSCSEFSSVYEKAYETKYTAPAIYGWIKKGRITAWILNGTIVVRKDLKLPPQKKMN